MVSPHFPEPPASVPASPQRDIDALVGILNQNKAKWLEVSHQKRIAYLREMMGHANRVSEDWADAACRARGIDPASYQAGEIWFSDPMPVLRNCRQLIDALMEKGAPKPARLTKRKNGQWVAQVFPVNKYDKLLFAGFSGEVWIEAGKEPSQGTLCRQTEGEGKVALVLGAGNLGSIGPMDALYKLFVENEVVVLKMNPVNEYLGPFLEAFFAPLIQDGFFGIIYGGAENGAYLTHHAHVDTIHITGSDRTHDAIVWGATPEEQVQNKAANTPALDKPISSELGSVTPVFIVPGNWSEKELRYQARHVASMVAHNGSFNCVAAKTLVLASGWQQKEKFRAYLREELRGIPGRKAYYPGAQQRYEQFLEHYPKCDALGERSEEVVPWTIIPDVAPTKAEYALSNEAFCGVLAEVTIEAGSTKEFLEKAAATANEEFWGTLACTILIDPRTEKSHRETFDNFISELRYGGISINCWAGVVYGFGSTTWGAFPGHPLNDIRSGRGIVHNTMLYDHPERSVARAPFRMLWPPPWFVTHRNLKDLGQRMTDFEYAPRISKIPGIFLSLLKG